MAKKSDAYIEYDRTVGKPEKLTLTAGESVVPVIVLRTEEGLRYPILPEQTKVPEQMMFPTGGNTTADDWRITRVEGDKDLYAGMQKTRCLAGAKQHEVFFNIAGSGRSPNVNGQYDYVDPEDGESTTIHFGDCPNRKNRGKEERTLWIQPEFRLGERKKAFLTFEHGRLAKIIVENADQKRKITGRDLQEEPVRKLISNLFGVTWEEGPLRIDRKGTLKALIGNIDVDTPRLPRDLFSFPEATRRHREKEILVLE